MQRISNGSIFLHFSACIVFLLAVLSPSISHAFTSGIEAQLIKKFRAGQPRFLAVDEAESKIYTTQWDGTVRVFDLDGKLVMTIEGRTADGTRVLKYPTGIALSKDRIYVADEGLNSVSIFNKDGSFVDRFGSGGRDPKEFVSPQGIRVEQGIVYVADKGNGRIQMFGLDGVFLNSFGTGYSDEKELLTPTDVARLPDGDIYVVDNEGRNIKFFSPDFKLKGLAERVRMPFAITLYHNGFMVADSSIAAVSMHDLKGYLQYTFSMEESRMLYSEGLGGIFLDSKLNLYIADTAAGMIYVYKMKGIDPLGEKQYPPPTSVSWLRDVRASLSRLSWDKKSGSLYAIDLKSSDVVVIKDGKTERLFGISGGDLSAVAVGPDGELWVSDRRRDRILKLSPDGEVLKEVGSSGGGDGRFDDPEDIVISGNGTIFVADTGNRRVQMFNSDGVFIRTLGKGGTGSFFERPVALALDEEGILYVLDGKKRSVLVFSQYGLPLNEFGKDEQNNTMFDEPVDMALNGEEVFVLDAGLEQVLAFNRKGKYTRRFGAPGSQKGDLDDPRSIDGMGMTRLAISDTGNERMQELAIVYTPDMPTGVKADAGMHEITVSWDASPEAYIDRYLVYRSSSETGPYDQIGGTSKSVYTDTLLEPGRAYYYRVSATAVDGNESQMSPPVTAFPSKFTPPLPQGVTAVPDQSSVQLTWLPADVTYVNKFIIERKSLDGAVTRLGETEGTAFVDSGLPDNTTFTYLVSALSSDNVESTAVPVQVTTPVAASSPLKMSVIELEDVFSNDSRHYEHEGVGRVRLTNAARSDISDVTVMFNMPAFMDAPTRLHADALSPGAEAELTLRPEFNSKILEVAKNRPVKVAITAIYSFDGQQKTLTVRRTVNVFEMHRTVWDTDERIATFITPDDQVVKEFTSSFDKQFTDTSDPLELGGMLFNTLGTISVIYQRDRTNPYQLARGKKGFVDFVQYPRETLERKSGDVDDLVCLYASVLEGLGIRTKVLFYPGHALMMFSAGFISEVGGRDLDGLLVRYKGRVWVPVDMTFLGTSFMAAWEEGSAQYRQWEGNGLLVLSPRDVWPRFGPFSLQDSQWRPPLVIREQVEQRFPGDHRALVRVRLKLMAAPYVETAERNPRAVDAMLQAGIIYARAGELGDARRWFTRALDADPNNAALQNNMGNVRFLERKYERACFLYEDATSLDAGDALAWVNLARCYYVIERYDKAANAFRKATELDNNVPERYRKMSLTLMRGR